MKKVEMRAIPDNTLVKTEKSAKRKKLGSFELKSIREQVVLENKNHRVLELNEEELYVAWGLYIEELFIAKNNSAVSNFKQARLKIVDENCIEIVTDNVLQQKFIEVERGRLITHLQTHFNNRMLTYRVVVVESNKKEEVKNENLSNREQFLKIIETYPMVKELKDRLGLNLDY